MSQNRTIIHADHLHAPLQVPTGRWDQAGLASLSTANCTQTLTNSGPSLGEGEGKGGYGSSFTIFRGAAWQMGSFSLRAGTKLPSAPYRMLCKWKTRPTEPPAQAQSLILCMLAPGV